MLMTIIVFVTVLSILILVHEVGHFLTARFFGVHVEEFGLGLPPRIFGRKIKKTVYSLNWLPIGGFVKLAGEDEQNDEEPKKIKLNESEYFWAKSKKQRALILVAGVFMNFILAVLITTYFLIDGVKLPGDKVIVEQVMTNSPAAAAGLMAGDRIVSLEKTASDGTKTTDLVKSTEGLISVVGAVRGQKVNLVLERSGRTIVTSITPRDKFPAGEGPMGVAITDLEFRKYPLYEAPFAAVKINIERAGLMIYGIGQTLVQLFTFKTAQIEVAGPIGIAQITGKALSFGFKSVLELMSLLSLNLAVLNILPFPALDGGRLFFVFAEKILGRKVKSAFEKQTHQIGMIILLFLVLLVTIGDISRIIRGIN